MRTKLEGELAKQAGAPPYEAGKGPIRFVERKLGTWARRYVWVRNLLRYGAALCAVVLVLPTVWPGLLDQGMAYINIVRVGTAILTLAGIAAATDTSKLIQSADEYERNGYHKGLRYWREQTSLRAGAMRKLLRQVNRVLSANGNGRTTQPLTSGNSTTGEEVARAFLGAIANAVAIQYGMRPQDVKVNLMVPTRRRKDSRKLELVAFAVEDSERAAGIRTLKVEEPGTPGAVRSYLEGTPQYIPDTHEVEGMDRNRPYRSIMSWPVRGDDGGPPIGVVNIDSNHADAFGTVTSEEDAEDRAAAYLLCSDVLYGLGIALLDRKCFPCDGTRE